MHALYNFQYTYKLNAMSLYNFQCPHSLFLSTFAEKLQKYMDQLLSISPLEAILIGIVAVGIFLFFRACWHNIQRSRHNNYNI